MPKDRSEGKGRKKRRKESERSERKSRRSRRDSERSERKSKERRRKGSERSKDKDKKRENREEKSRRHRSDRSSKSSKSSRHGHRSSTSKRSSKSRSRRSHRHRHTKKSSTLHSCSLDAETCPKNISDRRLKRAACNDRLLRDSKSVSRMIVEHGMTEAMLLKAMERQKAYGSMRSLALYLEIVCIFIVGIMGIFAQRFFNTRGDLHYYASMMTFEQFLLFVVICNIVSPSAVARLANIMIYVVAVALNFTHILISIRTHGVFFKCSQSEVMLQHCLFNAIPTHHHALYTSTLLLVLHVAITLINSSVAIFYDSSLDHYMERTPGAPQWVTDLPNVYHFQFVLDTFQIKLDTLLSWPMNFEIKVNVLSIETSFLQLHRHELYDAASLRAERAKKITFNDLPPGTIIIRQQEEVSVKMTSIAPDGTQKVSPEDVTITRSYTIDAPGMGSATGKRSWKKTNKPVEAPKSKDAPDKPKDAANKPGAPPDKGLPPSTKGKDEKPMECPCGGQPQQDVKEETRKAAGRETDQEPVLRSRLSRIPALVSRVAYLNNKNLLEKQSDYMF